MTETLEDIIETFSLLQDWEDRYRYVIELGRKLDPYPENLRDNKHKVSGCVSQVWLATTLNQESDPLLTFRADSDAHIVKGLVYILLQYYNNRRASAIITADVEQFLAELALNQHLTPQRSNGLNAMIARIRAEAKNALYPPNQP